MSNDTVITTSLAANFANLMTRVVVFLATRFQHRPADRADDGVWTSGARGM